MEEFRTRPTSARDAVEAARNTARMQVLSSVGFMSWIWSWDRGRVLLLLIQMQTRRGIQGRGPAKKPVLTAETRRSGAASSDYQRLWSPAK